MYKVVKDNFRLEGSTKNSLTLEAISSFKAMEPLKITCQSIDEHYQRSLLRRKHVRVLLEINNNVYKRPMSTKSQN